MYFEKLHHALQTSESRKSALRAKLGAGAPQRQIRATGTMSVKSGGTMFQGFKMLKTPPPNHTCTHARGLLNTTGSAPAAAATNTDAAMLYYA